MSEPAHGATLLRVILAADHQIIPSAAVCGLPGMAFGGQLKTVRQGIFPHTVKPSELIREAPTVHGVTGDYGVKWRSLAVKHGVPAIPIDTAGRARK